MQHDASLPEVVRKKLAMPGSALTPAESRSCLVSCIQHGKAVAKRAEGKRIVVVLGNTGAGKSAFVNLLHGCTFAYEEEDKMVVRRDSPLDELMRIGHSNASETFAPQVEDAAESVGAGFAFVDCPGFLDNRGFEINVANAVNVRHAVAAASSAVVVVVVNYYSLRADRGKGLHDLLAILLGLFGSIERVKANAPSVLLAISQAPVTHPETGAPMTLVRYQRALLDPAGLDETTAEVLRALLRDANVFIFHLLGRGDSSWLSREQILERVRALTPIEAPRTLFQSVLGSADRERLRALVATLGGEVRVRLQDGTPAAYAAAAALATELLELRLVEHGFVAELVEREVRAAIEERMTAVVALVDGLFLLDGALDGRDEAAAVQQLDEARTALRGVHGMLDAFTAIDGARELLQGMIAEAAAKLDDAERRRAEACGRMQMAAALQEALRSVGAHQLGPNYNVVREVLALPGLMAAAHEEQQRRRQALEQARAAEVDALRDAPAERVREASERHESALREHALRSDASNAAWAAHLHAAEERLRARDAELIAAAGTALCAKVGTTPEGLCAAPSFVDLSRKGLTPSDVDVAATLLRALPPLGDVKALVLSGNPVGDAGVGAIADAGAHGALANVERLFLDSVALSDAGVVTLARVCKGGGLPQLGFLDLTRNQIGDCGVAALADAVRSGALGKLRTLYLYNNRIGSDGLGALVEALCSLEAPPALEKLYLDNNEIREAGAAVLCAAIDSGRLPSLRRVSLSGNPVAADVVARVEQGVQRQAEQQAGGGVESPVGVRSTPQTRDIEMPPVG